jgi:hypothetical protein
MFACREVIMATRDELQNCTFSAQGNVVLLLLLSTMDGFLLT